MLFTFPSRYLSTIGHQVIFSLGRWSSQIPTGFLVSRGTRVPSRSLLSFGYGAITLYGSTFQSTFLNKKISYSAECLQTPQDGPTTPALQRLQPYTTQVWALPLSLAATQRISVDFYSYVY